jgi:hypothetical protein
MNEVPGRRVSITRRRQIFVRCPLIEVSETTILPGTYSRKELLSRMLSAATDPLRRWGVGVVSRPRLLPTCEYAASHLTSQLIKDKGKEKSGGGARSPHPSNV